jgi:hypothetical protein
MLPDVSREFQIRQVIETKEKYYPIFDQMVKIAPAHYSQKSILIRDNIVKLTEEYSGKLK